MPIFMDGKEYEDGLALAINQPTEQDTGEPKTSSVAPKRVYIPTNEINAPAGSSGAPGGIPEDVEAKENAQFIPGFNAGSWTDTLKSTWDNISKLKDVRMSDIVKGIADSAVSAATLPGDVLSGKVQPGSQQEIERAFDLAGMMVMGPAPVAKSMADGTLGSFAGVRSKSIDKARLYKAQEMEMMGEHADDIWTTTGFMRGPDKRWKYEIPDNGLKLRDDAFDTTITPGKPESGPLGWSHAGGGTPDTTTVSLKIRSFDDMFPENGPEKFRMITDVVDHPELFKAYPELKNIKVESLPKEAGSTLGRYNDYEKTLYLRDDLDPSFARSVIAHELQHAIQKIEGFAYGGNSQMFLPRELPAAIKQFEEAATESIKQMQEKGWTTDQIKFIKDVIAKEAEDLRVYKGIVDKAKKDGVLNQIKNIVKSQKLIDEAEASAYERYRRLAGEVEARNVQTRLDMKNLERVLQTPQRTEDVPRFMQEVIYPDNTHSMAASESKPTQIRRAANDNDPNSVRISSLDSESLDKALGTNLSDFKDLVTREKELWKKLDEAKELAEKNKYDDVSMSRVNKILDEIRNLE